MAEKTEQPTPKRLRDARKKGQVGYSRDLVATTSLLFAFAMLLGAASFFSQSLRQMISVPGGLYGQSFEDALGAVAQATLDGAVEVLAPLIGGIMVIGVVVGMAQIGPLLAFEALKPDLKKMNPVNNLKNMFSRKKMLELLFNLIKVVVVAVVLLHVIENALRDLLVAPSCALPCVRGVLYDVVLRMASWAALAFIALAIADFAIKKRLHIKELMMSKDEVKREFKEMEGDPHIKARRRQLAQQMALQGVAEKVKNASVIITNPRHIAVALRYDGKTTRLPVVTAKGEDAMARLMIETAKREGVPIMQNVPLARELYENTAIDQYIPSNLIEAVAAVLRWLQQLQKRQGG